MVVSLSASLILLMINIFSPPEEKPNILFLIADDWSYPHAGIYGDPVVRTPTFDRLAEEGALFEHAYTAAPS
jgi:arylsulfatase A-like enzyme